VPGNSHAAFGGGRSEKCPSWQLAGPLPNFLLGFAGPREEAEEIKQKVGTFLREQLKLELSDQKTLITHGRTQRARFLGYELAIFQEDTRHSKTADRRSINGNIGLRVPRDVVEERCKSYQRNGTPRVRTERTHASIYTIIMQYQAEYRGLVQYYQLAHNLEALQRLKWAMDQSLVHTLANKLQTTCKQVLRRYKTRIQTDRGPRVVLQEVVPRENKPPLIATWGAIPLVRTTSPATTLNDSTVSYWATRAELVHRLLHDTCELCGSQDRVQVHHVRHLKTLYSPGRKPKPQWVQKMAALHRKTLVVCHTCHGSIHAGTNQAGFRRQRTLESRMQ
jgi:hypothetical protein